MTPAEALERIDAQMPNTLTDREKQALLREVDGFVQNDIYAGREDPPEPNETSLLVPEPYDSVYSFYVFERIHLLNGEPKKAEAMAKKYEATFTAYRNDYNKKHAPIPRARKAV